MADNETDNKAKAAAGGQSASAQGQPADLKAKDYNIEEGQEDCSCSAKESGGKTDPAPNPDLCTQKEDSCVIHGKSYNSPCNADRLWLSYNIYYPDQAGHSDYDDNSFPGGVPEQFIRPLEEVRRRWEIDDGKVRDDIQYKARFYQPRAENKCNPTVVFRGTVGDVSGFGIYVKLTIGGKMLLEKIFTPGGDPLDEHMSDDPDYTKRTLIDIRDQPVRLQLKTPVSNNYAPIAPYTLPFPEEYRPFKTTYSLIVILGASSRTSWGNNIIQATMEGNPLPPEPFAPAGSPEFFKRFGKKMLSCSLCIIKDALGPEMLARTQNMEQKFGGTSDKRPNMNSEAYNEAAKFGQKIALKIKQENESKKLKQELFFAGHSLGGGLAACAAHWAQQKCPELSICGITYNAAGLNTNSVPGNYGYVGAFFNKYVEDEILSTVQLFPRSIPLLEYFLRILHIKLPQPYGLNMAYPPCNPDPAARFMSNPGADIYKQRGIGKGGRLPKLWPLNEQSLHPGADLSPLQEMSNMLLSRCDVTDLVRLLGNMFYKADYVTLQKAADSAAPSAHDWRELHEPHELSSVADILPGYAGILSGIKNRTIKAKGESIIKDKFINSEAAEEHTTPQAIAAKLKTLQGCAELLGDLLISSGDYHRIDIAAQSIFFPEQEAEGHDASNK